MLEDFRLKVFVTVASEGSFTKAAAVLGVSQPAVSQNVAELEKLSGFKLFERLRGEVVLTPQGVVFKEFAERIGVSCSQVNQILKGRRPVNTEFALLTEAATGIPADLLLRMQTRYDRIKAENKADFMEKLKKIKKFAAAL
jgi:addiction module HigA family antidote